MIDNILFDDHSFAVTDGLYKLKWTEFVKEVDKLTGGGPVARQMFIDARAIYLADKH